MFSGKAFVVTVKVKVDAFLSALDFGSERLISFHQATRQSIGAVLEKANPVKTREVLDVYQAIYDARSVNAATLVDLVRSLPNALSRGETAHCFDRGEAPLSSGIAYGTIIFDDELLVGDPLVEAEKLSEEAARRKALLAIDFDLLPDIYVGNQVENIGAKRVALFVE
jgi:hypothetical protein